MILTGMNECLEKAVEGLPVFCTRAEVADLLRCQKNFVSKLIQNGELTGVQHRAGTTSKVLVPRESIRLYLERKEV